MVKLSAIGLGINYLDVNPKAWEGGTIDKWDRIKFETFHSKGNNRMNKTYRMVENIYQISDKGLILKIHRKLKQLSSK